MPAECSKCKKYFTNMQNFCDVCNVHCHTWKEPNLPRPSTLPAIEPVSPRKPLFLSGQKRGLHKKRLRSDPTQAIVRVRGQVKTKTRRQQSTLERGLRNLRANNSEIVSEHGSGGALVQIHMIPSSRHEGRPSFYGVKMDGSVHPRVPTDKVIPVQYRLDSNDYDSSDEEDNSDASQSPAKKRRKTTGSDYLISTIRKPL